MPTHEPRNLTPPVAANAREPRQWIAVSELGRWLLSVRNDVSRGIGQSARSSRALIQVMPDIPQASQTSG